MGWRPGESLRSTVDGRRMTVDGRRMTDDERTSRRGDTPRGSNVGVTLRNRIAPTPELCLGFS